MERHSEVKIARAAWANPIPSFHGRQGGSQARRVLGLALSVTSSPRSLVYFVCLMLQLWFQTQGPLPAIELMEKKNL